MNITDEGMMGFNFSRKVGNFRIRKSSWDKYIEALEACLEAEEETQITQWFDMQNIIDNLIWNVNYGSNEIYNNCI